MSSILVVEIVITGLIMAGLYSVLAVGLNLQIGISRVVNMSHGEYIMLGAFGAYLLYTRLEINPFVSILTVAPILFVSGYLIYITLFQHLRKRSKSIEMSEMNSLLVSFGVLYIINNTALLAWGADVRAYSYLAEPVNLFGSIFAANRLVILLVATVVGLALFLFLGRARWGKAGRAVAQDLTSAQLIGINTDRILALYFGLGVLLAGVAGVLISMIHTITPLMGMPYAIIAIVVVVIGGLGNILGSLIGALILGFIASITMFIDIALQLSVFYAVFMLILLVRPQGVLGKTYR
ncbi:branched-chain amino acid ABC transporter permease [Dehalococcoidia bacterium]|nr:branched-chain amino acid ABC transporter permease [Dehalococcoidia bacterium]